MSLWRRLWSFIWRPESSSLWICVFLALYSASVWRDSATKPLWFDEICTYHIASAPNLVDMWDAIPADGQPPLMYLLTRLSFRIFGTGDFSSRLPEVFGFGAMCIALFLFVARRVNLPCAVAAMFFPISTRAYYYAYDARAYGLILGFAGLGLLSWQVAVEGKRRRLGLVGLAVAINGALWTHYYAFLLVIFPLLVGELTRAWRRRRIDWPVWITFATGAISLMGVAPLALRSANAFGNYVKSSSAFWAKPEMSDAIDFFSDLLQDAVFPVLAAVALALLWRSWKKPEKSVSNSWPPFHEAIAAFGFLCVPVAIILLMMWKTGYFQYKYAITGIIGVVVLGAASLQSAPWGRSAALLLLAFLLIPIGSSLVQPIDGSEPYLTERNLPPDDLPVVVASALLFLPSAHYATAEVLSRIHYLADIPYAVRQPDFLPELSMVKNSKLLPGKLDNYGSFIAAHSRFWLVYSGKPNLEWLPTRLTADGFELTFKQQHETQIWYQAERRAQ